VRVPQEAIRTSGSLGIHGSVDRHRARTAAGDGISSTIHRFGNRTSFASSSGFQLLFGYDAADAMTDIREINGNSEVRFLYDAAGRRQGIQFGQLYTTSSAGYGYDAVNRLTSLGYDLAGSAQDQNLTFGYNPASQIVSRTSANDGYASNTAYNVGRAYGVNGLNQYTAAGSATFAYDADGNLTSDGSSTYVYDAENRLVSRTGGVSLAYDPNERRMAALRADRHDPVRL
jgi:hypothetical protein